MQARLFPQTLPPLKTFDYAGICLQARAVGGDCYDFLNLGATRLGLVVADISGKGIAAALQMANLQAILRSQCAVASEQPQRFLSLVNKLFLENTEDHAYATLFFAEYDDHRRRLRYANCGHLSGLLLRENGSLDRFQATGTVVGLFRDWDCTVEQRQLSPGDTLLLYTDGITESLNKDGQEFGEQRVVDALRRHRQLSAQALLGAIVSDLREFSPDEEQDDITLIVATCLNV